MAWSVLRFFASLLAFGAVWGLVEPYFAVVKRYRVDLPDLPPAWRGAEVALVADLQLGPRWANKATVKRIVKTIVERRPQLVLIAGDFLFGDDAERARRELIEVLAPLAASGLPVYAVLGNHDYNMPTKRYERDQSRVAALLDDLAALNVTVLQNNSIPLPSPGGGSGEPLYLVGVRAHIIGEDDPEQALADLPEGAPRLVMMHHPNSFKKFPPYTAPFAVAGHTHGGQVSLPVAPLWRYLTYRRGDGIYVAGWLKDGSFGAPGNHLYINRGIGFSVLPLRINNVPELTLFRLESGEARHVSMADGIVKRN